MEYQEETLDTANVNKKATENNQLNSTPNTTSNNKHKPYNKKELMKLTPEQRTDIVLNDMKNQLDEQMKNNPKTQNFKSYLHNSDNKAFHLEIIKRSFKKQPKYLTPDDFNPVVAQYLELCYKHTKLPTLTRPFSFCSVLASLLSNTGKNNHSPSYTIPQLKYLIIFTTLL